MKRRRSAESLGGNAPPPQDGGDVASMALSRLADAGGKIVNQGRAIVEALFASETEVTANELWNRLRGRGHAVGRATVQRTLNRLVQRGLANQRRHGREQARFRPVLSQADHGRLVCTTCHSIAPFTDDRIETLHATIARRRGFEIRAHNLEIYGICEGCRGREGLD